MLVFRYWNFNQNLLGDYRGFIRNCTAKLLRVAKQSEARKQSQTPILNTLSASPEYQNLEIKKPSKALFLTNIS
jgi:hypothetical protein